MRDVGEGERIGRTIGRRRPPPPGEPLSAERRRALDAIHRGHTRAPKGVYRYASHEDANRDRDRWTVDAILAEKPP
jgi:hypothetical protein